MQEHIGFLVMTHFTKRSSSWPCLALPVCWWSHHCSILVFPPSDSEVFPVRLLEVVRNSLRLWVWSESCFPSIYGFSLCLRIRMLVAQSCLTLSDPTDCSPPGSSVHGILRARVLECVAISSSRGSSWPRHQTQVSCIAGAFFTVWATRGWNREGLPRSW